MNKIIICLAIAFSLFITKSFAQNSFENQAKEIANNIENITKTEKAALKTEIEAVNQQLDKSEITFDQAMAKKQELANIRAKNIEDKVAIEQQKLNDLVKEKVDGKIVEVSTDRKKRKSFGVFFSESDERNLEKYKKINDSLEKFKRTTNQLIFATGLNNALTNNSISNSNFRYFGSHFYEFGVTWNTRFSKTANLLHLKYGVSAVWNNLRPSNSREFLVSGNQTNLQTSPVKLEDSRFRNVLLTFPVHLEFDFSGEGEYNNQKYFKSHDAFRFAIGGYAGINLGSTQFSEISINKYFTETQTKGDFNTSNFIYGLSTYIGYKATSLYLKYDLNPLFRNNAVKQNNISLGIRWDLN
jgi:hypothetical protein